MAAPRALLVATDGATFDCAAGIVDAVELDVAVVAPCSVFLAARLGVLGAVAQAWLSSRARRHLEHVVFADVADAHADPSSEIWGTCSTPIWTLWPMHTTCRPRDKCGTNARGAARR